jgi:dTDP-4-dehydrorhamnose 3,5-epimerase
VQIEDTPLVGVKLLTPRRFADDRGYFSEVWNLRTMLDAGLGLEFVQDNHSFSRDTGTIRGLHYQSPPHAQAKLVRVGVGRILDVAVDIRIGSPTYGRWFSTELSAENGQQLLIPAGFLHGFATLTPDVEVYYKCSDFYAPECDGAVRFDDPDLAIDWQLPAGIKPQLSAKDAAAGSFGEFNSPFSFTD